MQREEQTKKDALQQKNKKTKKQKKKGKQITLSETI